MIRCNNCMATFKNERKLSKIVEVSEMYDDGNWHTIDRHLYESNFELINNDEHKEEVFNGCPLCLADEYLIDLTSYESEVSYEICL